MPFARYYDILEVPQKAKKEEIKEAYRRLAKRYHPDRNVDDPEAALPESLLLLIRHTRSDSWKKALYDQDLQFSKFGTGVTQEVERERWTEHWEKETPDEREARKERYRRYAAGERNDIPFETRQIKLDPPSPESAIPMRKQMLGSALTAPFEDWKHRRWACGECALSPISAKPDIRDPPWAKFIDLEMTATCMRDFQVPGRALVVGGVFYLCVKARDVAADQAPEWQEGQPHFCDPMFDDKSVPLVRAFHDPVRNRWERLPEGQEPPTPRQLYAYYQKKMPELMEEVDVRILPKAVQKVLNVPRTSAATLACLLSHA
ncbi:dnaJ [Symbiodinium sp. CCMP2456]|nr:dnaJ [Symbiodinium sp. CCMP2456]